MSSITHQIDVTPTNKKNIVNQHIMECRIECNGCTICCETIGSLLVSGSSEDWVNELIDKFPYSVDSNGVCEMLKDNKCSVYKNRPIICNINKTFYYQNITKSKKEWLKINKEACTKLKQDKNK